MKQARPQKAGPAAQLILITALMAALILSLMRTDGDARFIGPVAWLTAPPPGMTVSQAVGAEFVPGQPGFHDLAGHPALWARLTLQDAGTAEDMVLQVQPGLLDRVTLYLPLPDGTGWQTMVSGDSLSDAERPEDLLPIRFPVPAASVGRTLYLQVESALIHDVSLTADTRAGADVRMLRQVSLHVILFSLLGMAILITLLRFATLRSWLTFIAFASTVMHFALILETAGYAPMVLPGTYSHDRATMALTVFALLTSLVGNRLYLRRHRPHRFALRLTDVAICGQAALLPLLFAGGDAWIGPLSVAFGLIGVLLVACLIASARPQRRGDRRLLLLAYAIYLGVSAALLVAVLGGGALGYHLFEVLGLNNLLLILSVLWIDRQHHVRQMRETRLSLQLARSAQAARNLNATVQESFMHMLLHEVRNNLSILQLSLSNVSDPRRSAELSASIRDLAQTLADAQHATWIAQDNWPVERRQICIVDALDRVFEALCLGDRIELEGDDPEVAVWADAGMLHAVLSCILRAVGDVAGAKGGMRVTVSQAGATDCCRLEFQPLPAAVHPMADTGKPFLLARRIAERMGGQAEWQTGPCQVSLELPAI